MDNHELTPDDLEPEFRRIGTNAYDALRELVNRNALGHEDSIAPGEPINVQIDIPHTLRILSSLPNGAGAAAFADAMFKATPPPRRRRDGPTQRARVPNKRLKLAGPAFKGTVRLCANVLVPQGGALAPAALAQQLKRNPLGRHINIR